MPSDRYGMARTRIKNAGGLVTSADIARRYGVSRPRAHTLMNHPTFPRPVAETETGHRIYLAGEIDLWRDMRLNPRNYPPYTTSKEGTSTMTTDVALSRVFDGYAASSTDDALAAIEEAIGRGQVTDTDGARTLWSGPQSIARDTAGQWLEAHRETWRALYAEDVDGAREVVDQLDYFAALNELI